MQKVIKIPAQMDKHCGIKEFLNMNTYGIKNIGCKVGGAITARYCKGLGADSDGMVIVCRKSK